MIITVNIESIESPKIPGNYLDRLQMMLSSIRDRGLQNPLYVREIGPNKYKILDGRLRYLACKDLGHQTIRIHVAEVNYDNNNG